MPSSSSIATGPKTRGRACHPCLPRTSRDQELAAQAPRRWSWRLPASSMSTWRPRWSRAPSGGPSEGRCWTTRPSRSAGPLRTPPGGLVTWRAGAPGRGAHHVGAAAVRGAAQHMAPWPRRASHGTCQGRQPVSWQSPHPGAAGRGAHGGLAVWHKRYSACGACAMSQVLGGGRFVPSTARPDAHTPPKLGFFASTTLGCLCGSVRAPNMSHLHRVKVDLVG